MLFVVGGGLFGFLILIEIAGFYAAILAFMVYYVRILGRHSWWTTLSVSFGLVIACFFFFDIAMRIVLPKGLSEPLFIPLYEMFL